MTSPLSIPFALGLPDINPVHLLGEGISNFGLGLITPWVLDGAKAALEEVARIVSAATAPDLSSGWFSGEYWRVAALASMLTLPFIFAASVQAVLRSEPGLIFKVLLGYLPLAMIGISIASPLVMLMLSATNEMCSIVSATGANGGARFLDSVAVKLAANSALGGSPFFAVIVGLFVLFAALMLTLELLIREASVYIVVLMLPLAFAAMVWPARRIWAVRVVELLTSLILAKFVIVSVLSLAGAALGSGRGVNPLLTAMTLLMLSTLAPWALMRLLPFTEVAAAAAGSLRQESSRPVQSASANARSLLNSGGDPAETIAGQMRPDHSAKDFYREPPDVDHGRGGGRETDGPSAPVGPQTPTGPISGADPGPAPPKTSPGDEDLDQRAENSTAAAHTRIGVRQADGDGDALGTDLVGNDPERGLSQEWDITGSDVPASVRLVRDEEFAATSDPLSEPASRGHDVIGEDD
jgi:hypothetical protein